MIYKVNLDFDHALLKDNPNLLNPKYIKEFEYIFFLTNQEDALLMNYQEYQIEYLNYLQSNGIRIPKFAEKKSNYTNWWGDLSNFEHVKKIDSKIFAAELGLKYKLCPTDIEIVLNEEELELYLDKQPGDSFFYRSNFGFSGNGNKVLEKGHSYSLRYPGVVSKKLDVEKSFGITLNLKNHDYYIVENHTTESGAFVGGELLSTDCIAKELNLDHEIFEKKLHSIFKILSSELDIETIQFDSLIYKKNCGMIWYPLVEFNCRRTMGTIINELSKKFGHGVWSFDKWSVGQKEMTYVDIEKELSQRFKKNILVTSPKSSKILTYFSY